MHDLNAFQRDVLVVLSGLGPAQAKSLRNEISDYYETTIHNQRLYTNLDALAEKGLVRKAERNQGNSYQTTRRGERVIRDRWNWEQDVSGTN
jgi:DNA-binding PadR family transcriptional regulator